MRDSLRTLTLISLSLFGGLSFANAPVANLNVATGTVAVQPITAPANDNSTGTSSADNAIPQQPVVNSQALLASLTPEQRIARLENQVQYLSSYNSQLQSLTNQVSVLRGQIEDLNFQVKTLKKQVDTLTAANGVPAVATDNAGNAPTELAAQNAQTVSNGSSTTTNATTTADATTSTTTASTTPPTAAEQAVYDQANAYLGKQQYSQATTAFTKFLSTYPNSSLAPNVHYWLGDLYLAQGQPDNASQQYRAVVAIQNADKRPDAMVKLGTILLAYGDSAHAKQLFQQVVQQYPNSQAAKQAQTRLKSL